MKISLIICLLLAGCQPALQNIGGHCVYLLVDDNANVTRVWWCPQHQGYWFQPPVREVLLDSQVPDDLGVPVGPLPDTDHVD